ncbi:MAG: VOC family protein [Chloroflexota bacterium]
MIPTKLGHAHLKVRDLDRALAFYTRFFNLRLVERVGDAYAFLTGSDVHHELALNAVGAHAGQPSPHAVGLFHIAFEMPDKPSFAQAYQQLIEAGIAVGPVDHRISWAIYFDDPDGNGLEIYCDTRAERGAALWQGINEPLTSEMILRHLA